MDEHRAKSNIIYGPWLTQDNSSEFAIQTVRQDLRKHLETIGAAGYALADVCQLFDATRFVRPIDCSTTQAALQTLHKPVDGLCNLFSNACYLPVTVIPYRYDLLAFLYHIDEQIPQINRLLTLFRSVCLDSSRQALKQQQIIKNHLENITRLSKVIELKGITLLKEMD